MQTADANLGALLRKAWIYFAVLTAAALALRLFFIIRFPNFAGDALFYGELAKNWLQHGILGTTAATGIKPSLIRLPGYPAFLAAVWAITGVEHYRAVLFVQLVFDLGTCFLIADLALRTLHSQRAAKVAFLLAALCPFTANYVACALTETLAIFFTTLALDMAVRGLQSGRLLLWAGCGTALAGAILLRPDGGILLAVLVGYLLVRQVGEIAGVSEPAIKGKAYPWLIRAVLVSVIACTPLVPWTIRNWRDFHVLQPLAPRYANAPDQFVPMGFQRWVKTWMIDYVSVVEIYWQLDDADIDVGKAPTRAFDSPEQRQAVENLFSEYNAHHDWTSSLDSELGLIAGARIARHPLRYYFWLPAARIMDMWLRPRTEMIEINDRWWEIADDPHDCSIAIALGVLNLFYVAAAAVGLMLLLRHTQPRPAGGESALSGAGLQANDSFGQYWGLLLTFVVARSLFLGTLENPEPRYTLECYPVIIVLAAAALTGKGRQRLKSRPEDRIDRIGAGEHAQTLSIGSASGESLMRNCVRKCSDSNSIARRFPVMSALVRYSMALTSKRWPST